ncbi:DUF3540 domain-containing protein [Polyangium spumosum]|uniref:DUF3540 domain-containing protein n=1 Tax=Polyangium spumosum TaxID=889282 RepID=A0A6N7PJR1_9BACT|nr:DUF3540 domain-containing protein [Polyangium spumosum]MRG90395.1 DUF3540 domain-containing protein [Polyangium spumosum]
MDNLARKLEHRQVSQDVGEVVRVEGDVFVVRTDGGNYRARRAKSCLLAPEVDDTVLLVVIEGQAAYVLAVLEREDGATSRIVLDGDVELKAPSGRIGMAAQEGIGLVSGKEVSVVSGSVEIRSVSGNVVLERLSLLGTLVSAELGKVKLFAGVVDSALERLSQKVKRSYRTVEEVDQVRAERIDYAAQKNMSLRGDNTLITAEQLVKVDGEQIHLG